MKKGDLVKAATAAAQSAAVSGSVAGAVTWYKNQPWKTSTQIAIPERVGLIVRVLPGETRVDVLTVDGIYTYRFEQLEKVE